MGGDRELHQAAERHREREARNSASRASPEAEAAKDRARERRYRRNQLREALSEAGRAGKLVSGVALALGLFGPMAIAIWVLRLDSALGVAAAAVAGVAGAFVLMGLCEAAMVAVRMRGLRRIGRGFDLDGYLQGLSENRPRTTLLIRVGFATPWSQEARTSAPDAIVEWMPTLVGVHWRGDELELRSPEIEGNVYQSGGDSVGERFFNNAPLHACFLAVIRDVVPRLEAVAPIATLAVELVGPIAAWNDSP